MSISIITPHYNDLEGLKQIYECLLQQTHPDWEWVIVDDFFKETLVNELQNWHKKRNDNRVKLICNAQKSNASICRNIGANQAQFDNLIFLDSDDIITKDFVANRQIEFTDFAVFQNTSVLNKVGDIQLRKKADGIYLIHFLKADFIWPITAILWHKSFFNTIGQFHSELPRLQDVELAIRALQKSSNYLVLDNKVDFYYRVKPIRERKNFVEPVCKAVHLFISELLDTTAFKKRQLSLLSGYYFACTRYLERSGDTKDIELVGHNLNLFRKKGYIGFLDYLVGRISLRFYGWHILSGSQFLRINRYLFKPKKKGQTQRA